jgi:hypothetical protein
MKRNLPVLAIGLLTAATSFAQTAPTTTSTSKSTDHATPIGTSQETADKANQKATQEGGMATVVRTGPSAADHVKNATAKTKAKAKSATTDDSNGTTGAPKQ